MVADKAEFLELFDAPRRRFEAEGQLLIKRLQYEAYAEFNSPRSVARAYAAGLDAVQRRLGKASPAFASAGEDLINTLNAWIQRAERPHYDFIRAMKNPHFSPTLEDIFQALSYTSGVSALQILGDFVKQTALGLERATPDIKRMAAYYTLIGELDMQVRVFWHQRLWPALQRANIGRCS